MSKAVLLLMLVVLVGGLLIFGRYSKTAKEPIEDHEKAW